jgi:hypothetical protein
VSEAQVVEISVEPRTFAVECGRARLVTDGANVHGRVGDADEDTETCFTVFVSELRRRYGPRPGP